MLLAACQSAPEDVLGVDDNTPIPAQETTGTGPVTLSLLLPRTAGQPQAGLARDMHDGARLAASELGAGAITLITIDTKGQADLAKTQAQQAAASGAKLILTGTDGAAIIAGISAAQKPPVFDLSASRSPGKGVYAFASDEIASALEGVRTAVAAKQTRVVVVVPESMAAQDRDRLTRGVSSQGATLAGLVTYPPAENAIAAALAAKRSAFEKATTLVIFGSGRTPAAVANAVAAGGFGGSISTLVGNAGWARELYAAPVLDGALIAMIDQRSLTELGERYKAATGRVLSLEAAFAYDAVALAAGLARSGGAAAISGKTLASQAGFRGTTGIFRFDEQGNIERRHSIYRIEGGKLAPISELAQGF
jgi:hypothetical protein